MGRKAWEAPNGFGTESSKSARVVKKRGRRARRRSYGSMQMAVTRQATCARVAMASALSCESVGVISR